MMKIGPAQRIILGARRGYYRKRLEDYMYRAGFNSCRDFAKELGVTGEAVRRTLVGQIHSPVVLDALRKIGTPEEYLFDPRNYKGPIDHLSPCDVTRSSEVQQCAGQDQP